MISLEWVVSELYWTSQTPWRSGGDAFPYLKPKESDLERLLKLEAQRKGEESVLGQAAFPHPEKFLEVQMWSLLRGILKRDPTEDLPERAKRWRLEPRDRGGVTGAQPRKKYCPYQVSSREDSGKNIAKESIKAPYKRKWGHLGLFTMPAGTHIRLLLHPPPVTLSFEKGLRSRTEANQCSRGAKTEKPAVPAPSPRNFQSLIWNWAAGETIQWVWGFHIISDYTRIIYLPYWTKWFCA